MSANLEWSIPFTIRSTYGDLDLNDDANALGLFLLVPSECSMGRQIRATVDDVPQGDGSIPHSRFWTGYQAELTISLWESRAQPACDAQAREMAEELMLHLNLLANDTGRLLWTPSDYSDDRMMDEMRTLELDRWQLGEAGVLSIRFVLDSPFPYVIDATQLTESLADNVQETITNSGNVPFFPVVKVDGPTSSFVLSNDTTGEELIYDSTLPGGVAIAGGDYVEFDFFRNTAYLNGAGSNRKASIDVESSDFWTLAPGANLVTLDGATGDVLYNPSWA